MWYYTTWTETVKGRLFSILLLKRSLHCRPERCMPFFITPGDNIAHPLPTRFKATVALSTTVQMPRATRLGEPSRRHRTFPRPPRGYRVTGVTFRPCLCSADNNRSRPSDSYYPIIIIIILIIIPFAYSIDSSRSQAYTRYIICLWVSR